MKNIIILPGNSSYNKNLINSYSNHYQQKGYNVISFAWKHWEDGGGIDFEYETKRVLKKINKLKSYNVIAKSIGTYVFAKIIEKINLQKVQKCILMGLPYRSIDDRTINIFKKFKPIYEKLHIVQEESDPYASFDKINSFVRQKLENSRVKLHKIPGNEHSYPIDKVSKLKIFD